MTWWCFRFDPLFQIYRDIKVHCPVLHLSILWPCWASERLVEQQTDQTRDVWVIQGFLFKGGYSHPVHGGTNHGSDNVLNLPGIGTWVIQLGNSELVCKTWNGCMSSALRRRLRSLLIQRLNVFGSSKRVLKNGHQGKVRRQEASCIWLHPRASRYGP